MANIALIYGGFSREREVSQRSAAHFFTEYQRGGVIKNGRPVTKHRLTLVELDRQGFWVEEDNQRIQLDLNDFSYKGKKDERIGFDGVVFLVHGMPLEDGKLQGYFEMLNLPYVGSSGMASQLTFNKYLTNTFLRNDFKNKVKVAKAWLFESKNWEEDKVTKLSLLSYPCFAKPNSSGSSFGAKKIASEEELINWLDECFLNEGKDEEFSQFLVEEYLSGREFTCGAYNTEVNEENPKNEMSEVSVLPITEIKTDRDFFDFDAKYLGGSEEITPAEISNELTERIQTLTREVFIKLGVSGFARVDFIVTGEEAQIYFVEINTIPGFTQGSLFPQQLKAAGIEMVDFTNGLIDGLVG